MRIPGFKFCLTPSPNAPWHTHWGGLLVPPIVPFVLSCLLLRDLVSDSGSTVSWETLCHSVRKGRLGLLCSGSKCNYLLRGHRAPPRSAEATPGGKVPPPILLPRRPRHGLGVTEDSTLMRNLWARTQQQQVKGHRSGSAKKSKVGAETWGLNDAGVLL